MCGVQNAMGIAGWPTLLHFASWRSQSAWGKHPEAAHPLRRIGGFARWSEFHKEKPSWTLSFGFPPCFSWVWRPWVECLLSSLLANGCERDRYASYPADRPGDLVSLHLPP